MTRRIGEMVGVQTEERFARDRTRTKLEARDLEEVVDEQGLLLEVVGDDVRG